MSSASHGNRPAQKTRNSRERVAIVGGGIVGLAHAWAAARRGCDVLLFERGHRAQGASIRNFGMVWPIGQPNGPYYRAAKRSRECWLDLIQHAGIGARECGSLHLAYRQDELAVLQEFAALAPALGYDCRLLSPHEVFEISPAARREGLLAGLCSPTEIGVDPREVIGVMPRWLAEEFDVKLHYGVAIERVTHFSVVASDGTTWHVDRTIVATGADFQTLFPEVFSQAGFGICKLQMFRTVPQPRNWKLGPMLAGGLTLRHYEAFKICHHLTALKQRIAQETPELDQYGIHVMASQNNLGEVVLGDSHEYDGDVSPFDKTIIEELMLRELRKLIDLPEWTIRERWHGIYATLPDCIQFVEELEQRITIVIATGGCGMTMSFGLAEQLWDQWNGPITSSPTVSIPEASSQTVG
ncbi:MAG: TIGR03364 family FAD-dependent oxidoreductase [Bythopirellula sp.]|nr:TIGR03364 family FAD-dependent oxidoreductase [Bythopirellula sp.]